MRTPILCGLEGLLQGRKYVITAEGLHLGRDPANEVHIDDPSVSRHHARVILYNDAIWVQDAGARNGVLVNGERITRNRELNPGDAIEIGKHRFGVSIETADRPHGGVQELRMDLSVEPEASKKKPKLLLLALVPVLVILLLVGVVLVSGGSGTAPPAEGTPDAFSLTGAMDGSTEGEGEGEDLLSALGQVAADPTDEAVPDPPEGATLSDIVDQAHVHYAAGRLHDALIQYKVGLKLDSSCEICLIRIEKVTAELKAAIDSNYRDGYKYFESMQYPQAVAAWETVLLLEPNPESEIHKQTQEYLELARQKMLRR